jgi:predicted aspartyl protease
MKLGSWFAVAALSLCGPLCAEPVPQVPDEPLYAAPTRLDRIGRILAPVMINGLGPFRLTVDTGANQSVITAHLAEQLGLAILHDQTVTLNGVTGSAEVPTAFIDTFNSGALVQHSLTVPVLDTVMGGAEGILGMQDMTGKRITVDFARDRIEIARSRGQHAGWNFLTVPARLRFGSLLVVDATVGGVRAKAVIDTGAERTLGNTALRAALIRWERSQGQAESTQITGLTQEEQTGDYMRAPPIVLGEVEITQMYVVYGDIYVFKLWNLENEPALVLGMDVLGILDTLIIDYRRNELQIRRRSRGRLRP